MTKTPDLTAPAIGISLTHTVAENRNIVLQAFVPADCSDADFNAVLDKCFRASARQQAMVRLPQAQKDLARLNKAYTRATEDMFRLDAETKTAYELAAQTHEASGRRGEAKLTAAQVQAAAKREADRANAETSLKRGQQDIELLKEEIADLEAIVAGTPQED